MACLHFTNELFSSFLSLNDITIRLQNFNISALIKFILFLVIDHFHHHLEDISYFNVSFMLSTKKKWLKREDNNTLNIFVYFSFYECQRYRFYFRISKDVLLDLTRQMLEMIKKLLQFFYIYFYESLNILWNENVSTVFVFFSLPLLHINHNLNGLIKSNLLSS